MTASRNDHVAGETQSKARVAPETKGAGERVVGICLQWAAPESSSGGALRSVEISRDRTVLVFAEIVLRDDGSAAVVELVARHPRMDISSSPLPDRCALERALIATARAIVQSVEAVSRQLHGANMYKAPVTFPVTPPT